MFEDTQILRQPRRPQFSLRTLFVFMTGVSRLLGLGYWMGWSRVSGALFSGTTFCQLAVTLWPAVVGILWCMGADAKIYGHCVLVLGILFVAHLLVSVVHVEILLRGPVGLASSDVVIGATLNWTVPCAAIGILVGMYFGLTARSTLPYLVGCFLAAVGLVGFVWLAARLDPWLGPPNTVWWM